MKTLSPSDLARLTGVSPDTLRHYERMGLLAPQRTASGYRRYTPESVNHVRLIRRALIVGFSLKELAHVLNERQRGGLPCQSVRLSVENYLSVVDDRLKELRELKRDLTSLLHDWDAKLATTPPGKQARLLDYLADANGFEAAEKKRSPRAIGNKGRK